MMGNIDHQKMNKFWSDHKKSVKKSRINDKEYMMSNGPYIMPSSPEALPEGLAPNFEEEAKFLDIEAVDARSTKAPFNEFHSGYSASRAALDGNDPATTETLATYIALRKGCLFSYKGSWPIGKNQIDIIARLKPVMGEIYSIGNYLAGEIAADKPFPRVGAFTIAASSSNVYSHSLFYMYYNAYDMTVRVYSASNLEVIKLFNAIAKLFPREIKKEYKSNELAVKFWSLGPSGPKDIHKTLIAPQKEDILTNYNAEDRAIVERLINFKPKKSGPRLILLSGLPGSGKSTMLRTVLGHWQEWGNANYIMDPISFFGASSDYLSTLIFQNSQKNHFQIYLLEDVGELLHDGAKAYVGQGLGQLLNASSGFIGEGTNNLFILTTNDKISKLSAAVSRPGRCALKHEFGMLSVEEANDWLVAKGSKEVVTKDVTIAELYAIINDDMVRQDDDRAKPKKVVGFTNG